MRQKMDVQSMGSIFPSNPDELWKQMKFFEALCLKWYSFSLISPPKPFEILKYALKMEEIIILKNNILTII